MEPTTLWTKSSSSPLRVNDEPDLPSSSSYRLKPTYPSVGWSYRLRHPLGITCTEWYGNINPFPIAYAFRPRLRLRLTLSGLTLLRKPWAFGEQVSHLLYRYSCQHSHFHFVHQTSRFSFNLRWNAPLPPIARRQLIHVFGVKL